MSTKNTLNTLANSINKKEQDVVDMLSSYGGGGNTPPPDYDEVKQQVSENTVNITDLTTRVDTQDAKINNLTSEKPIFRTIFHEMSVNLPQDTLVLLPIEYVTSIVEGQIKGKLEFIIAKSSGGNLLFNFAITIDNGVTYRPNSLRTLEVGNNDVYGVLEWDEYITEQTTYKVGVVCNGANGTIIKPNYDDLLPNATGNSIKLSIVEYPVYSQYKTVNIDISKKNKRKSN